MFGKDFTRRSDSEQVNAYLDYGYTVLRAAAARAIVAAGLHPSLGLHHRSKGDALRLADDLMEPFRPAVDLIAHDLQKSESGALAPSTKRRLAAVLHADYAAEDGASTLSNTLTRLAQSLAQVYLGQRRGLVLPLSPIPLPQPQGSEQSSEIEL
jgi:CRISPR-associated protein Cas1